MKQIIFIFFTLTTLIFFAGCSKEEEESIDLDMMVMEDDDILDESKENEPLFTPQEIIVKELPETQAVEGQR